MITHLIGGPLGHLFTRDERHSLEAATHDRARLEDLRHSDQSTFSAPDRFAFARTGSWMLSAVT